MSEPPPSVTPPRVISTETVQLVGLEAARDRPGLNKRKRRIASVVMKWVPQWRFAGRLGFWHRAILRTQDWYEETVTLRDTGEVVHHCAEPLRQHRGHGSAMGKGKGV
jgi:hypothetical protein